VKLHRRARTMLAWSLFLATLGCCVGGLVAAVVFTRPLTMVALARSAGNAVAFPLGFATIGLVLGLRRPANPIGWLFAAAGLVWSLQIPGMPWVEYLLGAQRPLPLAAQLTVTFGDVVWAPAIALGVTLPLLLLPDGRLRSLRWRPAVVASLTGALLILVGALKPGQLVSTPLANPLALRGWAGTAAWVADSVGGILHVGSLVASLVCVVLRFRSSRGVERQQLRWVAAGAAVGVLGLLTVTMLLVGGALFGFASGAWVVVAFLTLPCMPAAIAVAVLRYRLWDLDRLVSRTATYTLVTALLVVPYLLILRSSPVWPKGRAAWPWPPPPWPWRPRSNRCATGSRTWSTGASTGPATTPPAPWRRSPPGCASRSTWTSSPPSCWPWWTTPSSRPRRRCGYARPPPGGRRGSAAAAFLGTEAGVSSCCKPVICNGCSAR
jgi:hypothetical protein